MRFTKLHGLGNDYLYVYGEVPENVSEVVRKLSDRHYGAGSDGMIFILPSEVADFKMRMFNADGTEGRMCGNGIRGLGKYVYDKGYTDKTTLKVETLSGIRTLYLTVENGKATSLMVDMGRAVVDEPKHLNILGNPLTLIPVTVGTDHAVSFVEDMDQIPVTTWGPLLEYHEAFPEGVNVEFVQVLSRTQLRMRVWERGSGLTWACGTGSCASVVAAIRKGFCDYDTDVSVLLDGGTLHITVKSDETITMRGPSVMVYDGDAEV